jgi:signal transduction histidine kinase
MKNPMQNHLSKLLLITSVFMLHCRPQSEPGKDSIALTDSLCRAARDFLFANPQQTKALATAALQEARQSGYSAGEAQAMNELGLYYYEYNRLDSAQVLHRQALEIRRKLGNLRGVAFSLTNLATAYQAAGLFKEATTTLDSAIILIRQAKDTTYILKILQQKGFLERDKGNLKGAKDIFLSNYLLAEVWGDAFALAFCTKSLGTIYDELGIFDSSLYWNQRSLKHHEAAGDTYFTMGLHMNMSRMYMDAGRIQDANTSMDSALKYFRLGIGHASDSMMMQHNMLLLKLRSHHYPDSIINQILDMTDAYSNYYKNNASDEMARMEAAYLLSAREAKNRELEQGLRTRGYLLAGLVLLTATLLLGFRLFYVNSRNKQHITEKELSIKDAEIKKMIQDQELNAVNAALAGQDEERNRIARELHDRLGHILSIAKLNFTSLQEGISSLETRNKENYHQVASMLDEATHEVRRISHDLYGSSVVNFGLVAALRQLASAVSASNNLHVEFNAYNVPLNIEPEKQMNVYRIAGELMSNTIKYAKASRIDVQLLIRDGSLILGYEDDGIGFDAQRLESASGIGFRNIQARLQKINGTYTLESKPGKGMFFEAVVPIT